MQAMCTPLSTPHILIRCDMTQITDNFSYVATGIGRDYYSMILKSNRIEYLLPLSRETCMEVDPPINYIFSTGQRRTRTYIYSIY